MLEITGWKRFDGGKKKKGNTKIEIPNGRNHKQFSILHIKPNPSEFCPSSFPPKQQRQGEDAPVAHSVESTTWHPGSNREAKMRGAGRSRGICKSPTGALASTLSHRSHLGTVQPPM